jgi:hypothetical protein
MVFTTERPKIQRVHVTVYDPDKRAGSRTITLYGLTVEQAIRSIAGQKPVKPGRKRNTVPV